MAAGGLEVHTLPCGRDEHAKLSTGRGLKPPNDNPETLYLTATGSWFLHIQGVIKTGLTWRFGEDIQALSSREAEKWLKEHNQIGALEQYFGGQIEDA